MKAFFYKIRVPLLEWYFASAVCYFFLLGMNLNILTVGLILGLVETHITTPIRFAIDDSSQEDQDAYYAKRSPTWGNIGKAFLACGIIYISFYLINTYVVTAYVEPFTFGAAYWILDKSVIWVVKKCKKKPKETE